MTDEQGRLTPAGQTWLGKCLSAGQRNCVALKVLRGEEIDDCEHGLQ